ncbi:SET domain-containing protein-lysine N-methyltransferase [bacterium]|nr:SET domain-containing protein-lysine N-methyltransferase [bacterium]
MLRVGYTENRGRGVFAEKFIPSGTLLEDACVIVVPPDQLKTIKETILFEYFFQWKLNGEECCAICLGNGSLYNHSSHRPNARYIRLYADMKIRFIAIRDIAAGEEILTNYNGEADCRRPLWFEESHVKAFDNVS